VIRLDVKEIFNEHTDKTINVITEAILEYSKIANEQGLTIDQFVEAIVLGINIIRPKLKLRAEESFK